MEEDKGQRLQVFLAHAGVASRRAAENMIAEGRVKVNGETVTKQGTRVYSGDTVKLDGKELKPEKTLYYLALNKPPGYICSSSDPQGRSLALDLMPPEINKRLYNVGRLDYMSSGLIFFSNDGDFTAKLSHPRSNMEKEYNVEATAPIPDAFYNAFRNGISIDGIKYKASNIVKTGEKSLRIILIEGKNREIRRVFSHFHLHPRILQRVRIGPVLLGNLAEGKTRALTEHELEELGYGNRY